MSRTQAGSACIPIILISVWFQTSSSDTICFGQVFFMEISIAEFSDVRDDVPDANPHAGQ